MVDIKTKKEFTQDYEVRIDKDTAALWAATGVGEFASREVDGTIEEGKWEFGNVAKKMAKGVDELYKDAPNGFTKEELINKLDEFLKTPNAEGTIPGKALGETFTDKKAVTSADLLPKSFESLYSTYAAKEVTGAFVEYKAEKLKEIEAEKLTLVAEKANITDSKTTATTTTTATDAGDKSTDLAELQKQEAAIKASAEADKKAAEEAKKANDAENAKLNTEATEKEGKFDKLLAGLSKIPGLGGIASLIVGLIQVLPMLKEMFSDTVKEDVANDKNTTVKTEVLNDVLKEADKNVDASHKVDVKDINFDDINLNGIGTESGLTASTTVNPNARTTEIS